MSQSGPNPLFEGYIKGKVNNWRTSQQNRSTDCRPGTSKWLEFYQYTNMLFQGRESCDCWRDGKCCKKTIEIRRYKNSELNLSISFVQWFVGRTLPHGTFDLFNGMQVCPPGYTNRVVWEYPIQRFLSQVIPGLHPTDIIVGVGWHPEKGKGLLPSEWKEISETGRKMAKQTGAQMFWKTTPKPVGSTEIAPSNQPPHIFSKLGWKIYDAAKIVHDFQELEKIGNREVWADQNHLTPLGNTVLLKAFLKQLCEHS